MSIDLPNLPNPALFTKETRKPFPGIWSYTADQMRAYAQEAARQAMGRIEPLRHAGAMLSNCAFNLAQRNPGQFTARDIEALDSSRKAWDEALRALIPQDPDHLAGVGNMVDGKDQSEKRHG